MTSGRFDVSTSPPVRGIAGHLCAIMLVLLCALPLSTEAQDLPTLTGRVVDAANIIDAGIERDLNALLTRHEQATGNQVVVVTVKDLQDYPIEAFALALGRGWGIGQEGKNNGVILLVAPTERKVRIEVGYGLEGTLPDATAKTIIDQIIVPAFKAGQMAPGIQKGAEQIVAVLEGNGEQITGRNTNASNGILWLQRAIRILIFLLFIGAIVVMVLDPMERRHPKKSPWDNNPDPDDDPTHWHAKNRRNGRHRRIGIFGGGFSDGGFSGGGGSFGGGGASGGW